MSTEDTSPDYGSLLSRVEAIESDALAMRDAQRQSRLARLVLILLLICAAVLFIYLFMNLAMRFTDSGRQKDFATVALNQFFEVVDFEQREAAANAEDWDALLNQYSGKLTAELQDLGQTSMPVVQAAFRDQMNKDAAKHRAMLNEQRDLLVRNIQEKGEKLLQDRYQKILDKHEAILREEFKDLDDEKMELMMAHLNVALNRLLRKYYRDEIESELNQLLQTYDEFEVVSSPKGDETLQQQLLGTSMELIGIKIAGDPIGPIPSDSSAPQTDTEESAEDTTDSDDEASDSEDEPAKEADDESSEPEEKDSDAEDSDDAGESESESDDDASEKDESSEAEANDESSEDEGGSDDE